MTAGEHSSGTNTTTVAVITALLGAIIGGAIAFVLLNGQLSDKKDELAAATLKNSEQAKKVSQLTDVAKDLASQVAALQSKATSGPGGKQTGTTSAEGTTDLADGRYITHVEGVDATAGSGSLTVDVMQWFTGNAANKAARQDGEESPVPNDYYIRNENPQLRTLTVAPGTGATVIYWHKQLSPEGRPVSLSTFAEIMSGTDNWHKYNQGSPYWITLQGGVITKIEAQYLP